MCKLKLWYLTILWKTRWVGGWGGGGGAQAVLEIQVEGGGGVIKTCLPLGGLDFFWNNPISTHLYQSSSPFKKKTEVGKKRIGYYFL